MINGIGPAGAGRVDQTYGQGVQRSAPVEPARLKLASEGAAPKSPAAELAAAGPPVDVDKVAKVRAMIANGSYRLDLQAIADRMIELDILPRG